MLIPSRIRTPDAPVRFARSLPARSTKWNFEDRNSVSSEPPFFTPAVQPVTSASTASPSETRVEESAVRADAFYIYQMSNSSAHAAAREARARVADKRHVRMRRGFDHHFHVGRTVVSLKPHGGEVGERDLLL